MKRIFTKLLIISTVFFSIHVSAQNDPYFTHYMLNKLAYNPAVAGEKEAICVNAITHQQWLGQEDQSMQYKPGVGGSAKGVNPATSGFSITAPVLNNAVGVGLQVITDKLGYNTALYFRGSASYKKGFGRKLNSDNVPSSYSRVIAVGADFGMAQVGMDGSKYNAVNNGDPLIPTSMVTGSKFDMGLGAYYTDQTLFDGAYVGLSATHLTAPSINVVGNVNFTINRYLYLLAGTRHAISGNMMLLPSILVKQSPGSNLQVDMTARLEINQKLMAGLNLRTNDAISIMLGYYIRPHFYAGYSYDITAFSKVNSYVKTGTHEIFLSYCFDLTKPPPPQVKPRFNVRYIEGYTY